MLTRSITNLLALCAVACGSASSSPDGVASGWQQEGIEVADLQPAEKHSLGDAECQTTVAGGVQATLCVFGSEDAATAARRPGLASVGEHTGTALSRGRLLLVLADRDNSDPEGRTIKKLTRSFLGK